MTEVVSIRFKSHGKLYFFDPSGIEVKDGDRVVVETSKGLELGECAYGNHTVEDEKIVPPLRPVIRIATADDMRVAELNKSREKEAFDICQQKIADHGLDMKLVDVECNFEGNKIMFFFSSEGRVDFRELVKDLASVFRTRIELRQIGVRDEAKMLGGIGICGRPFCCNQFLDDFQPVSTKMAKTQSLSLNPAKISGSCGRLMCCLRYEQDAYEDLVKNVPKDGAFVETTAGYGTVAQINLLRQTIKVKMDGEGDAVFKTFDAEDVAAVPGGRPKPGEPLPSVLKPRPKKKEEEAQDDTWFMPAVIIDGVPEEKTAESGAAEKQQPRKSSHRRPRHRGGGKKPENGAQKSENSNSRAEQTGAQSANEAAGHSQKQQHRPNRKPQTVKPKSADTDKQPEQEKREGEKPKNHRSHHRGGRGGKPKNPGTGTAPTGTAPKTE